MSAHRIEVRERRISADYTGILGNHGPPYRSNATLVQYAVIVDGRQVDSFMSRALAEKKAAALRERDNA